MISPPEQLRKYFNTSSSKILYEEYNLLFRLSSQPPGLMAEVAKAHPFIFYQQVSYLAPKISNLISHSIKHFEAR